MDEISRSRGCDKEIPHGVLPMEQLVLSDKWARNIYHTTALIVRKNALSLEETHLPFNVYSNKPTVLAASIVDSNRRSVAEFAIKKFCVKEHLFDYKEADMYKERDITGSTDLVQRVK